MDLGMERIVLRRPKELHLADRGPLVHGACGAMKGHEVRPAAPRLPPQPFAVGDLLGRQAQVNQLYRTKGGTFAIGHERYRGAPCSYSKGLTLFLESLFCIVARFA